MPGRTIPYLVFSPAALRVLAISGLLPQRLFSLQPCGAVVVQEHSPNGSRNDDGIAKPEGLLSTISICSFAQPTHRLRPGRHRDPRHNHHLRVPAPERLRAILLRAHRRLPLRCPRQRNRMRNRWRMSQFGVAGYERLLLSPGSASAGPELSD